MFREKKKEEKEKKMEKRGAGHGANEIARADRLVLERFVQQ